jgi:hypothetical protein
VSIGDRISALKVPLLGSRRDPAEQERLLKLYWNRAELKKELGSLDDQLYQLRDRLKQEEAATERVREEKESLEVLLGNPELGFGALVHFQLRALWKACTVMLEQFGSELKRQQEDRERKRQLVEFHQDRQARVRLAEERLGEASASLAADEQQHETLRAELATLTSFWHYFRRRRRTEQLARVAAARDRARQYLSDMTDAKRTIEKEPWPEFAGIALEGRRAINVAVLAYAQLLYARLAESGLAQQARLARQKSVHEQNYGAQAECLQRMTEIGAALALVRSQKELAQEIRTRSERIKATIRYPDPADALPEAASLPSSIIDRDGGVPVREPNVMADDYWEVGTVLLS